MNKRTNKVINLIDRLPEILEPMHDVVFIENAEGSTDIIKNYLKFGIVQKGVVYFINTANSMQALDKQTLSDPDKILRIATKAYWKVNGKK